MSTGSLGSLNIDVSAQTASLASDMGKAKYIVQDSTGQMVASFKLASETAEQLDARIKGVAAAAMQYATANEGCALSARALAEAQREEAAAAQLGMSVTAMRVEQSAKLLASFETQQVALATATKDFSLFGAGAGVAATETSVLSNAIGGLTFNSRAMYSLSALGSDLATGQFSRMRREIAALVNETGLLGFAFTGVGAVLVGALAAFGAVGYELYKDYEQIKGFNDAIIATGNYSGQTAESMQALTESIAAQGASYSLAQGAVTGLANSGKITADAFDLAAKSAADFSQLTGESIKNADAEIVKLAEDPAKAILKLDATYHVLTLSQYDNIVALQKAGDTNAAFIASLQALDAAQTQRIQKEREEGIQLSTLTDQERALGEEKARSIARFGSYDQSLDTQIAALQKQVDALNAAARSQALYTQTISDGNQAQAQLNTFLDQHASKAEKLAKDLQVLQIELVKIAAAAAAEATQKGTWDGWVQAFDKMRTLAGQATTAVTDLNASLNKTKPAIDYAAQDQQLLNTILDKAAQAVEKVNNLFDEYSSGLGGPWIAAQNKYNATLKELDAAYEAIGTQLSLGVINQDQYNAKLQEFIDVSQLAGQALDDQQQKIIETTDILGNFDEQTQAEIDALKTSGVQHEVYTALLRAENETRKLYNQGLRETPNLYQYEIDGITKDVTAHHDLDVATKASQEALKAWGDVAKNAFDGATTDFSKWVVEGGSFMSSLKTTAQQTVEAIIAQFARLELLGPFMHMLFGDAANAMGYSAAGMSGMQGVGGLVGSLFGGGGGFGSSGSIVGSIAQAFMGGGNGTSSGSSGSLTDLNTWFGLGQHIYSGFESGFSGLTSGVGNYSASLFGTETYTPGIMGPPSDLAGNFMGPPSSLAGNGALGYGGYGSALGQGLGVAGGVIAGYNEYNAAGGGLGGLAGGAAYGVGTYLVGAGVTAAMAGGASAGIAAMGALGPVGWIALAAMAINMISGGKLFGTAASPTGGDLTETIGPGGATLTNILHEKGQRALFGGAYYKDVNQPIDPQAQAAADAFFNALEKSTTDFASYFGTTMTNIVGGSFDQKYDKHGKPTTSSDTVLGVTYAGETQAQFASRIQAENFIAVLDKLGVNATAYSQSFIGNADNLLKAIQDLGAASQAAYADINRGMGLLGPSGNLGAVVSEVEKLDQSGETLANAYARLVKEEDAWKGSMEAAVLSLNKSSTATLEFADSLSKAFGSDSAMQQALQTFDKNFYSSGQGAALKIANDKAQLATLGAGIGQSPTETVAQFFAAFNQVEATLSPEDLAKWINYGNLLVQVNGEVASAADSYAQFMAQFQPAASGFEQAMQKVSDTLAANIAQANNLAQANGQAGASAADIGKIISASVLQGVQAVQQLETEAANLSQTLFQGDLQSQITKLTAEANAGNGVAAAQLMGLQTQLAQQQAAAAKQQQFLQAAQLLGDLGQIGAVTGQGLGDFAKMFNIPLDKFASILGTDQSGLKAEFAKQEEMAKSALETASNTKYSNELQADILATLQGNASPFSTADLYAALTGTEISNPAAPGGKTGARGATGGPVANGTAISNGPSGTSSDPVTTKNPDTTTAVTNQTTQIVPLLKDIRDGLRDRTAVRDRYYSPRNTRPISA